MKTIINFLKSRKPCYIVIVILVIALIFAQQCESNIKYKTVTTTITDTVYNLDTLRITEYKPVFSPGKTIYVEVPLNCDECKSFNIGIGGMIGGSTNKFGAGASAIITTNKHTSYAVSYDAINKTGYFSLYYNLK